MKNTILWGTLIALIGTQAYADEPTAAQPAPTAPITAPDAASAPQPETVTPQPATTAPQPEITAPQPATAAPQSATSNTTSSVIINCDYKIPPETKTIDPSIILTWSEQAVVQAFSFDPNALDAQMQKLQACFTEQGWTGFNAALQKSGNIEAIKAQKLVVHSQIEGQSLITETKENQWKLTLPITVTYQNEREQVNQLLSVDLTVSRKPDGDLGIIQMIASPRDSVKTAPAVTPAPADGATNPQPLNNPHQ